MSDSNPVIYAALILSFVAFAALAGDDSNDPSAVPKHDTIAVPAGVPLNSIWANDMVGTRDIKELEPDRFGSEKTSTGGGSLERLRKEALSTQILDELHRGNSKRVSPSGFAVHGTGLEALAGAHAVLCRHENPSVRFPNDVDVSLVFFSFPLSFYLQINEVVQSKNEVVVKYELIPHSVPIVTHHLAIIPLRGFRDAEVRVRFERMPMDEQLERNYQDQKLDVERRIVCQPFAVQIGGRALDASASAVSPKTQGDAGDPANRTVGRFSVPVQNIWAYQMPGTLDIRDLEPDRFGPDAEKLDPDTRQQLQDNSYSTKILLNLQAGNFRKSSPSGFAMRGSAQDALAEAYAVLCEGKTPSTHFFPGETISIAFFSYQFGYYVEVTDVEVRGTLVTIGYRLVHHMTKELTQHLAIIPLPTLPPGRIRVEYYREPIKDPAHLETVIQKRDPSVESQIVPQSFTFTVGEKAD